MKIRNALSSFSRLLILALLPTSYLGSSSLEAQTLTPSRITAPINEKALASLQGSVHPLARPQFDRGAAPVSLPAERMLVFLRRGADQQQALDKYLSALQDPASSSYHKFVTPEQFGKFYGPSDADIQTLSGWLQGHGLKVSPVSSGRTTLEFSGNVQQVQDTFKTSIHSFVVRGEQHWANTTDPKIPAALAPVIAGLSPLNNFTAKAHSVRAPNATYDPSTRKTTPLVTNTAGTFLYVGPADAATIYNIPSASLNINYAGSPAFDGTGVTIAIAGTSNINTSDVDHYRSLFGLASGTPQIVIDGNDPQLTDSQDEALLDLEIAGGVAPGAKTILYTAAATTLQDGLFLSIVRALQDNTASILNVSFGNCEANLGTAGNQGISTLWEQAAAQGISVTVSTGDSGSAGCEDPNVVTTATKGLGVNGLASTPFDIAVGGTDFVGLSKNFAAFVSANDRANTRGSALKYIPEVPWNDSPTVNGMFAQNTPFVDSNGNKNIVAAGGGPSSFCVTIDAQQKCVNGYPKPAWQKNVTLADNVRDLPDVSLLGANGAYSATWAICASKFVNAAGVTVTDCVPDAANNNNYNLSGFGGTSTASPAFAGMLALVEQSVGHRLGQANVVLYKLSKTAPTAFHDITTGNISVVCTAGSTSCGANGFLTGYDAGTGYDLATGLGSVDVTAMIQNWAGAGLTSSNTTLTISPTTFAHGTSVAINAAVAGTGGVPTGDIGLVTNSPQANEGGLGVATLSTAGAASTTSSNFPGGSYVVSANYGGDTIFAGSTSPGVSITVTPEASALQLTGNSYIGTTPVNVANTSIPFGTYVSIDATPIGHSQQAQATFIPLATGSVTFTDAPTPLPVGVVAINSNGTAEEPTYSYTAGPHSITAAYSGDASFLPSNAATPIAFTVTDLALAAAPATLSLTAGQSKPLNLSLTPSNGFTGTVTLVCAITAGPAKPQSIPTCNINPASVTITGTAATTAVLTVATTARSTAALHMPGWITSGSGLVLACMFFFAFPKSPRNWRVLSLLLFVGILAASGCGGGGGGGTTTPPAGGGTVTPATTAGNYTVTVTSSTNGNIMHQVQVAVTVN